MIILKMHFLLSLPSQESHPFPSFPKFLLTLHSFPEGGFFRGKGKRTGDHVDDDGER